MLPDGGYLASSSCMIPDFSKDQGLICNSPLYKHIFVDVGNTVSSLVESSRPEEEDGDTETSWESAGQAGEGSEGGVETISNCFATSDIPMRHEPDIDVDCSSVQNSPVSHSSGHGMSLDEFEH